MGGQLNVPGVPARYLDFSTLTHPNPETVGGGWLASEERRSGSARSFERKKPHVDRTLRLGPALL